jgi:ATP-dependent DNA ligase
MLAKAAAALPVGDGWLYEPKWDGFRCIAYRDGDEVELGSRNERSLLRYFPELPPVLRDRLPARCVLDGELVVPAETGLDFDALGQRIHPAESRVRMLAEATPATFIAFDLLALGDEDLRPRPLAERRARLEEVLATAGGGLLRLSPSTTDVAVAERWFEEFEGAGLDGIVAKRLDEPYQPGVRSMVKVKHERTADCVVAGFRWHKDGKGVGSLLLGLYDDAGVLHHVGVVGSFPAAMRRELVDVVTPLRDGALPGHPWAAWAEAQAHEAAGGGRMPGAPSRWNATKDLSWEPVRPERVAEVRFSQLTGGRFRHNAQWGRWRPDRDPRSCTYDQLEVALPVALRDVLG